MWLFRSVLVWILVCTIPVGCCKSAGTVIRNLVSVSAILVLLHFVTRPYKASKSATSALRSRMLSAAITIPIARLAFQAVVGIILYLTFIGNLAELQPSRTPASVPNALPNNSSHEKSFSDLTLNVTSKTFALIANSTAFMVGAVVGNVASEPTVSAVGMWMLSHGYLSMVTTFGPNGAEVEVVKVRDILTYASTGTLGMIIGGRVVSVFNRFMPTTRTVSVSVSIWRYGFMLLDDLLNIAVLLSSQVFIAQAVAAKHVLGSRSSIIWPFLLAWFVLVAEYFRKTWFSSTVLLTMNVTALVIQLTYITCACGYLYLSRSKTKCLLSLEEARTRAKKTRSILSSAS